MEVMLGTGEDPAANVGMLISRTDTALVLLTGGLQEGLANVARAVANAVEAVLEGRLHRAAENISPPCPK